MGGRKLWLGGRKLWLGGGRLLLLGGGKLWLKGRKLLLKGGKLLLGGGRLLVRRIGRNCSTPVISSRGVNKEAVINRGNRREGVEVERSFIGKLCISFEQKGDVDRQYLLVKNLQCLLVKLDKLLQLNHCKLFPEAAYIWKVPFRDLSDEMDLAELLLQLLDQFRLGFLAAKHARHLLLQVSDDECMHAAHLCSLDHLIALSHGCLSRQRLEVFEEVLLFRPEEFRHLVVPVGLIPKRAQVYPHHLGIPNNLAQGPHKGTIHSHELLHIDLISLVKHTANLILIAMEALYHSPELIRYIQLMRIE
mmetsp:Transcript_2401/g.3646  ORF Transcript_2401/g.3646 Transcript_2401/m.3646 type:complete len:305 (+) Transcript_2401:904-1818(+)